VPSNWINPRHPAAIGFCNQKTSDRPTLEINLRAGKNINNMTITKKDIRKLEVFYHYLNLYLADWQSQNFFYHDSVYQRDLTAELINANSLKEAAKRYQEMDADDQERIKDELRAKELSFKASPATPLHYYKFNYIKLC
jgi:hypothetical protein